MKKCKFLLACLISFSTLGIMGGLSCTELNNNKQYDVVCAEDTLTQDLDFTNISGFDKWSTDYLEHTVEYEKIGTVTFESANRQNQTIKDMPVTKGKAVSFVGAENLTIVSATLTCKQWGSKTQTISSHYSTDGGKTYTKTADSSGKFVLTSSFGEGVNAIKFTFDSQKNQVGIQSLSITYKTNGSTVEKTLSENYSELSTISSQLSFGFTKEMKEAVTYTDFTNMSLNFKSEFDFTGNTQGTDFTEAGMMIVKGSDVSATYSKKTANALPEGAIKATQTNYGKEFIVRLEDIPAADWETKVTVVPYILIEGTYYFGTAGVTSVIETAAAYASSDATITLSDGSVVNVRDVAAAIKN